MAMFLRIKSHVSQSDTNSTIAFLTLFGWQLLSLRNDQPTHRQRMSLERIPQVETMEKRLEVEGSTTTFAVCPSCCYNHPPIRPTRPQSKPVYPHTCSYIPPNSQKACDARLLKDDGTPIRYTVYHHLRDFIGRIHAREDLEKAIDEFCDDCMKPAPDHMTDIRHGKLVRELEGHDGRVFVDRGDSDESRVLLALNMDGFRVEGSNLRGPHKSSTVVSAAVLNLPGNIRYDSGVMDLVTVIPGNPSSEEFQQHFRPFVDDLVESYEEGIFLSKTATRPEGRTCRVAIAAAVTDIPAGRTTTGQPAVTSHHYCTVCQCFHVTTLGRTDVEAWVPKNDEETRRRAEQWLKLSPEERDKHFETYGSRWTQLYRLRYWRTSRQLVVDAMHALFLRICKRHSLSALGLTDDKKMLTSLRNVPSFSFAFELPPRPGVQASSVDDDAFDQQDEARVIPEPESDDSDAAVVEEDTDAGVPMDVDDDAEDIFTGAPFVSRPILSADAEKIRMDALQALRSSGKMSLRTVKDVHAIHRILTNPLGTEEKPATKKKPSRTPERWLTDSLAARNRTALQWVCTDLNLELPRREGKKKGHILAVSRQTYADVLLQWVRRLSFSCTVPVGDPLIIQ